MPLWSRHLWSHVRRGERVKKQGSHLKTAFEYGTPFRSCPQTFSILPSFSTYGNLRRTCFRGLEQEPRGLGFFCRTFSSIRFSFATERGSFACASREFCAVASPPWMRKAMSSPLPRFCLPSEQASARNRFGIAYSTAASQSTLKPNKGASKLAKPSPAETPETKSDAEGGGAKGGGEHQQSIIPWMEQFAKQTEKNFGTHESTANAYLRLAQAYQEGGKPPEQVYEAASKALGYFDKLNTNHELVRPVCYNIMAIASTDINGPESAIPLLQKALNLVKDATGKETLLVKFNSYYIMGDAWSSLSRHQDAVWCMLEGFKCLEKAAEEDEDVTLFFGHSLRRISEVYLALLNYEEAENYALQALKHHRGNKDEPVSTDEIEDRRLLANIYSQSGDLVKALSHLETIRTIFEEKGEEIDVARTDMDIADLLVIMEKYDQAIPAFESSLKVQREYFGESHPSIASTLSSMAFALVKGDRIKEAERLSQDALSIVDAYKEEEHLNSVANVLTELGEVYAIMKKPKRTIELFERSIEIRQRLPGQLLHIAGTEMNIGIVQLEMLDYDKALETFTNVLPKIKTVFGKDNALLANVLNYKAVALCGLNQKTEAVDSFKQAIQVINDSGNDNMELFADVCGSLATVLHDLGRHDEAIEYQEMTINSRLLFIGDPSHPLIAAERERMDKFKEAKALDDALKDHKNSMAQQNDDGVHRQTNDEEFDPIVDNRESGDDKSTNEKENDGKKQQ